MDLNSCNSETALFSPNSYTALIKCLFSQGEMSWGVGGGEERREGLSEAIRPEPGVPESGVQTLDYDGDQRANAGENKPWT